jgi:hypothetical protein
MVSTGVSELLCATSDEKPSIKIQYSTPEQLHSLARSVTVMRSSRLRVDGLVLLPHFIRHFFPELHHRYVM